MEFKHNNLVAFEEIMFRTYGHVCSLLLLHSIINIEFSCDYGSPPLRHSLTNVCPKMS